MTVQLSLSATGRVAVIALMGEHDLVTAAQLRQALVDLCSRVPLIVIDFAQATFIDSTIIGVLAAAWKRAEQHGNQLVGINAHSTVSAVLHQTGVDALLQLSERVAFNAQTLTLEQELAALLSPNKG